MLLKQPETIYVVQELTPVSSDLFFTSYIFGRQYI